MGVEVEESVGREGVVVVEPVDEGSQHEVSGERRERDEPVLRTSLLPRGSATKVAPPMTTSTASLGGGGGGAGFGVEGVGVEDGAPLRTRVRLRNPPGGTGTTTAGVGAGAAVVESKGGTGVEVPERELVVEAERPGATQVELRWKGVAE